MKFSVLKLNKGNICHIEQRNSLIKFTPSSEQWASACKLFSDFLITRLSVKLGLRGKQRKIAYL